MVAFAFVPAALAFAFPAHGSAGKKDSQTGQLEHRSLQAEHSASAARGAQLSARNPKTETTQVHEQKPPGIHDSQYDATLSGRLLCIAQAWS